MKDLKTGLVLFCAIYALTGTLNIGAGYAAEPELQSVRAVRVFESIAFEQPLFLTYAPDQSNRIFVVEKKGRILVLKNNHATKTSKVFLDIRAKVSTDSNEEGLLGLAFDPDYATNGFIFIYYSGAKPRRVIVERYKVSTANPDAIDPSSGKILLEFNEPYGNHNGGMIAFGPDKMLYLGVGDGGAAGDPHNNGQNINTLLGKILRIDPRSESSGKSPYRIPSDNPFVKAGGNSRGEIWAYGMRNPWRFSFDRETGSLWAGDVGQHAWEEVDIIVKGGNYGWNILEGSHTYKIGQKTLPDVFKPPVIEYDRDTGKCVTGGYVYRGKTLPGLQGKYIYGDFVMGTIWALDYDHKTKTVRSNKIIANAPMLASFGEDEAGEVYAVSLTGEIWILSAK